MRSYKEAAPMALRFLRNWFFHRFQSSQSIFFKLTFNIFWIHFERINQGDAMHCGNFDETMKFGNRLTRRNNCKSHWGFGIMHSVYLGTICRKTRRIFSDLVVASRFPNQNAVKNVAMNATAKSSLPFGKKIQKHKNAS